MTTTADVQKRLIQTLLAQVNDLKAANAALKAKPEETETETFLRDYERPQYLVPNVELDFILNEDFTVVKSKLSVVRAANTTGDFDLDGENLDLQSLCIDGKPLTGADYTVKDSVLTIPHSLVPDKCELTAVVHIKPQDNLQLSGLYKSSGMFCTQCEAEGFRRIT